jgi:FkbM family methyltransferase
MSIKFISNISNYEESFSKFVDNFLKLLYSEIYKTNENHILIDVGANEGIVTEIFLKYINNESGKIISIDAHPNWQKIFMFNNNTNIAAYNVGCYSSIIEKSFIDTEICSGMGFIGMPPKLKKFLDLDSTSVKKYKMQCDTLDNILKPYINKKIAFIKIDAESCDFEVILGGKDSIKKNRPCILFEFSGQIFENAHGHDRYDFFSFFDLNNYSLYSIINGKTKDFIFDNWDNYTPELHDILAIPNEFNYIV